jgi:hypothetical protein
MGVRGPTFDTSTVGCARRCCRVLWCSAREETRGPHQVPSVGEGGQARLPRHLFAHSDTGRVVRFGHDHQGLNHIPRPHPSGGVMPVGELALDRLIERYDREVASSRCGSSRGAETPPAFIASLMVRWSAAKPAFVGCPSTRGRDGGRPSDSLRTPRAGRRKTLLRSPRRGSVAPEHRRSQRR